MRELEQAEDEYSDVCSELSIWSSLVAHAGWEKLKLIAEGQINERVKSALRTPLQSLDAALAQEFTKGEAAGIEQFQSIPELQIELLKADKERLEKEIDDATRSSSVDAAGGSGSTNSDGGRGLDDGYNYERRDKLFTDDYPTFGGEHPDSN